MPHSNSARSSLRAATRRVVASFVVALLAVVAAPTAAHAQKALVICPPTETAGCERIASQLLRTPREPAGTALAFPGGVDKLYDALRTIPVADLGRYALVIVPSLANQPLALLREPAVQARLRKAVRGRVAVWSGTPDRGSVSGASAGKLTLIQNLARWATGDFVATGATGLVVLEDFSDPLTDGTSTRFAWLEGVAGVRLAADVAVRTYAHVEMASSAAASAIVGGLAYDNMASFGLIDPAGGDPATGQVGAWGQTSAGARGQAVLVTFTRAPAPAAPVDAAGGTVILDSGRVQVALPAGAIASDVVLTGTPVATTSPTVVQGSGVAITPAGLRFATPVTITLSYAHLSFSRYADLSTLGMRRLMDGASASLGGPSASIGSAEAWEQLPTVTVDTVARTVTAVVSATGTFAISPPRVRQPVGAITLAPVNVTLAPRGTQQLTATIADDQGTPVSGVAVSWQVIGDATIAPAADTTDAAGRVTAQFTTNGASAGATYTVTASAQGQSATSQLTIVAGGAASITARGSTVVTAAVASTRALEVQVRDANGNPVPGQRIDWMVSGGGTLSTASSTTDASGVAGTVWTLGSAIGPQSVTASAAGLSAEPVRFTLTATAGAPSAVTSVLTGPAMLVADGQSSADVVVRVRDVGGNAIAIGGATVVFRTTAGTLTSVVDRGDGSYAAGLVAPTTAGQATITATVNGVALKGKLEVAFVTVTGARVRVTPAATSVVAGATVSVTVQVLDDSDRPVGGAVPVTWTSTNGGTFATATTTTDDAGAATNTFTASTVAGTAHVITVVAGALNGASAPITVTAAAPVTVTVTAGATQAALAGTAVATAPAVRVVDAFGNGVPGVTVTFAVAAGGGSVTGGTAVTNAIGYAAVGRWTLGTSLGANTLTATVAGLAPATVTATAIAGGASTVTIIAGGTPQTALAGTAVATAPSVRVVDANGNPIAGVTVTFAVTTGNGTLTGATPMTDVMGVATLGGWSLGTVAGSNTVTATVGTLPPVTFAATGTAGAATTLIKSAGDAQSAAVATAVATAPAVRLADARGNAIAGVTVTFAVTSGGGSVTGATATTDANGIARVGRWTLGPAAGANTLTATAGALSATFSATGTVGGAMAIAKTAGDAQSAAVGTATPIAPAVRITDGQGNSVAGVAVTFAIASGGGSVTGATQTTDATGLATVGSWTLGATVGAQTLTATAGSLSTTFSATGTAGSAGSIATIAGAGQSAVVRTVVAVAPSVRVTDANNNPVAGVVVTFAASGTGTVTGATQTTGANGTATVGSWTLGSAAGTNTLTATVTGLPTAIITAVGTPAAAATITKTAGDAQTAVVGGAVAAAVRVTVADQYGNPIPNTSVVFAASGTGSVTGSPATTDANGVATLGSWTLATATGPNTLTATAGALQTTFSATGSVGPVANVAIFAGNGQTASAGGAVAILPAVRVTDAYDNPIVSVPVTFATTTGTVVAGSQVTNASGVATVGNWTLATNPGPNTLVATVSGLAPLTFGATGVAGTPAALALTTQPSTTAQVGVAFGRQPVVQLRDQYGNPSRTAGVVVTAAIASGGGTMGGSATATTDANGTATFGGLSLSGTIGDRTLSFSATGFASTISSTITLSAGSATQLAIATQPSTTAQAGVAFAQQPVVQLRDVAGNAATQAGVTITASIGTGGGTLGGAVTATTDANGTATFAGLSIGGSAGSRTLSFSATSLTGATSNAIAVSAASATQLSITTQPSSNATPSIAFAQQPVVQLCDANGAAVSQAGVVVTATIATGGGALGGTTTATTDASGAATFTNLSIGGAAGARTLSFSATGLTSATSATVTTTATAATQLAITTQPSTTAAAGVSFAQQPTVQLRDGVGAAVSQAGVVVTATIATGGGTLTGTATATTDASGLATFSGLAIGGTVGSRMLGFSAGSLTGATSNGIAITAGAASQLTLTTQPSASAQTGVAFPQQPVVQLRDQYGNASSQAGVSVTAAIAAGGGTLGGTTTVTTDASGVATFAGLTLGGTAGSRTLSFSATGLTGVTSNAIALSAGAATQLAITTQPSASAAPSVAFGQQPIVQLRDANGNAVSQAGVVVTAAIATGGGTLGGVTTATTDANGAATFTDLSIGGAAGARTLAFSATGLTSATSTTVTTTATPATQLAITTQPSITAAVGVAFAQQPVVQLRDANGNATAQAGVTVTASIASGSGTLGGTATVTTDANGVATFATLAISGTVGSRTISFAASGLIGATSNAIAITAGAATQLAFTTQPSATAQAGVAFSQQPIAQLRDASGNAVGQAGVSVTVAIASGGGTLGATATATTDANGAATFTDLSIGGTIGGRTLSAAATGLTAATSSTVTITAGAATTLAVTTQASPAAQSGVAFVQQPVVTLRDQYGNASATAGVVVTAAIATGGGTLGGTMTATTDTNGAATFSGLAITGAAGNRTLSFSATGVTSATSGAITIGAATATQLSITTEPSTSVAAGVAFAQQPAVQLRDANGNVVSLPGVSVTASIATGGGTLGGTTTATTDASGVATFADLSIGGTIGSRTLSFVSTGFTTATSNAIAVTAGAASQVALTTQPSGASVSGVAFARQPVAQLRDQFGNATATAGISVTAAIATGGGTLGGTATVTTDAAGTATFSGLSISGSAGSRTLSFSSTGLTAATSSAVVVTVAGPTQLSITTQPSTTAQSGVALAQQPVVQILDQFGAVSATAGVSVTASIAAGATLGGTTTVTTDANGVATFTNLVVGGPAGSRTLSFAATNLTGATSTVIAVSAAAATQLSLTTQPSTTAGAGVAFSQQPVIQLLDANGNPTAQAGVTVTAAIASGGGTLGGTLTATTDSTGAATFAGLTIGGTAGSRTLSFSATSLTGVTSGAVAVSAGAAAALSFQVEPSSATATAPITPAVQVAIVDAYGNVVTGATNTVTVAIGTNPSAGTLGGTRTVAAANGVATFSTLTIDQLGTGYTLAASAGALTGATSASFNVVAGTLDHFVVEAASGGAIGSQQSGTPFNVRVTAKDAYNNTLTSFTGTVDFTTTPAGTISAGATSGAFTNGVLTSHAITVTTPGSLALVATRSGGTESGTSATFAVQSAATATNDGPSSNSAPGAPYHAALNTTYSLAAPGVLSNDVVGFPTATVEGFGADSLGGLVNAHAAGTTVSPLPGHADGSLTVSATGAVSFTPPTNFTGLYVFRYRMGNGTTSADAQVTIAVGARPVANNDTYSPTLVGNVSINTATSSQFRVTSNDQGDRKVLAITGQTNGTATLNADSTFTFTPTAGYSGPASFTYTVTNGFGTSAPATVSLTVGTPIWFVNAAAAAGGNGTSTTPFNTIASFAAINNDVGNNPAAGDAVFVYSGSYLGPLTLLTSQKLIGQGASASLSSIAGVTWPADAGTEPATGGTAPTIGTAVPVLILGNGNTLRGVNLAGTNVALSGSGFGTLTVGEVGISTTGQALDLTNGTITGSFTSVRSTGGTNNVFLSNVATSGTVTLGGSTDALSGATGDAFKVAGGTGSFTYAGTISNSATLAVNVSGKTAGTMTFAGSLNPSSASKGISITSNTGGTITFTGAAQKISSGTAAGVSLVSNTGATINFSGGALAISTGTGTGFSASGGGTVNVTGSANTLASTGGTPINVSNTTIGSSGLTFRRIDANGGSNGIVLVSTGTLGSLTVTGTGVANSGGTIQYMTGSDGAIAGNGIYLSDTRNVSLSYMALNDHQNNGVYGTGVRGISLNKMRFTQNIGTSNSGAYDESPVHLVDVGGAVSITNSRLDGGAYNGLLVENITGTAPTIDSLVVAYDSVTSMQGSTADVRSTALLVNLLDGTVDARIRNNYVTAWWGNAIHVLVQGTASGSARITGNFADNQNGALAGAGGIWVAGGTLSYNISGNTVRHTNGTAISADRVAAGANMNGTIDGNTIGMSGDANSGSATGIGIFASHHGSGTTTVKISNNVLRQINGSASGAITTTTGDAAAFGGSGTINATITGNNIQESGTTVNNAQQGILITHGINSSAPGDTDQGCYDIQSNVITSFTSGTANNRIRVNQRFGTTSRFPGYAGAATGSTSQTDLATYLLGRNTASTSTNANSSTGGFLNTISGAACTQPSM